MPNITNNIHIATIAPHPNMAARPPKQMPFLNACTARLLTRQFSCVNRNTIETS